MVIRVLLLPVWPEWTGGLKMQDWRVLGGNRPAKAERRRTSAFMSMRCAKSRGSVDKFGM